MLDVAAEIAAGVVDAHQLLMPCGNDPDYVKEGGSVQGILKGKGLECPCEEFGEMKVGWTGLGKPES